MSQGHYLRNKDELDHFCAIIGEKWLRGEKDIRVEFPDSYRTTKQNSALHKYFSLVAGALKAAGIDARKFFRPEVEIPVSAEMLKRDAWKPIQDAMIGEASTTKLTRKQVNEVYEVFDRHLAQSHGIHIPFPSNPPLEEL